MNAIDRVRELEPKIRDWAEDHGGTTAGLTTRWIKTPSYKGGFHDGAVYRYDRGGWIKLDKKHFFQGRYCDCCGNWNREETVLCQGRRYPTIADALEGWVSPFTGAHYVEQGLAK